jgi:3-deoxy-7-phosphoheptulonate synthase
MYLETPQHLNLKIIRQLESPTRTIRIRDVVIGDGQKVLIAGPCAVESESQLHTIASRLTQAGVRILRGGAYKPRTSPYAFQGMREQGIYLLANVARIYNMVTISEMVDTRLADFFNDYIDIIQIGSRNMQNYELLKVAGQMNKPIFLKRGYMATVEETLNAAEYLLINGNQNIILCERGIRTFETSTRNTLDLAGMVLLKRYTSLPVFVDVSHALGRKDILPEISKAVLATDCDGLMMEVHHDPAQARSDADQQLTLDEFLILKDEIDQFLNRLGAPAWERKETVV